MRGEGEGGGGRGKGEGEGKGKGKGEGEGEVGEGATLDPPLIRIYPNGCFGVMCGIAVCFISCAHRALSQNTHTD